MTTFDNARELRMKGAEAMAQAVAAYSSNTLGLIVLYPGGGWSLLNIDNFDAKSELRAEAHKQYQEHLKRNKP